LDSTRIVKILGVMAFFCITLVLYIIAVTPPAIGYELSIYDAYSQYFWVFLIGSIVCGISILIQQAFAKQKSNWWLVGLSVVIFSTLILLNLHSFRGYAFPDPQDAKLHLARLHAIINTGHIEQSNFYPIIHLIVTILITVMDLTPKIAADLTTSFFYILYMINMCLLATSITRFRGEFLLVLAFTCTPLWSIPLLYIHPSGLSVLMLPSHSTVNGKYLPFRKKSPLMNKGFFAFHPSKIAQMAW